MKLTLSQRYVHEGKFFGPGPVEFDPDEENDERIYRDLKKREERREREEKRARKASLSDAVTNVEAQVHPEKRGPVQEEEVDRIGAKTDSEKSPNLSLEDVDEEEKPKKKKKSKHSEDYSSMKTKELRKLANKREIPDSDNMTKEELVAALEASDNP